MVGWRGLEKRGWKKDGEGIVLFDGNLCEECGIVVWDLDFGKKIWKRVIVWICEK